MEHSNRTLLWDTLKGHSCETVRHSCGTRLRDTLVGLLWDSISDTLVGHSCGSLGAPQIIPLTSDTLRVRQHVSRSPVAHRHANALSTKAALILMALRHHERRVATRPVQTLEANMSHDTTNHPAHQRRAAFTPAFSRSPVARRHANTLPTQAAQIPMALQHHERRVAARSAHTEANISQIPIIPLTSGRVYASMFRASQWHGATQTHSPPRPREPQWHCNIPNVVSPHGLPIH